MQQINLYIQIIISGSLHIEAEMVDCARTHEIDVFICLLLSLEVVCHARQCNAGYRMTQQQGDILVLFSVFFIAALHPSKYVSPECRRK